MYMYMYMYMHCIYMYMYVCREPCGKQGIVLICDITCIHVSVVDIAAHRVCACICSHVCRVEVIQMSIGALCALESCIHNIHDMRTGCAGGVIAF